jgi:hypothetical protein
MLARGTPAATPAPRALAAPSAPLPAPLPPASALRATPEAKQKLCELLQKMGARRGGGGVSKPKAAGAPPSRSHF